MTGAEIKLSRPIEDKHPVVLGRLGRNPDQPTICFYGHYGATSICSVFYFSTCLALTCIAFADVQPAMEREWQTDPFEVTAVNGYLYGRGTSDNKACRGGRRCAVVLSCLLLFFTEAQHMRVL